MNVSIFYRSTTVWNIILFTLLIFFFLFFQEGLLQARSIFEPNFLKEIVIKYLPLNALLLISAVSIFRLKSGSKYLFSFSCLVTAALTAYNLYGQFSKLVVISLFLYILTAYYFYQFLCIEIDEAYYNPQYSNDDLFEPMLKKLDCEVVDLESGKCAKARLTNWNPNGCFVYLGETTKELKFKNVKIKTSIGGRPFEAEGSLASKAEDQRGFGFRLRNAKEDDFGWRDYYSIIDQMGYNVELLK